MTKDLRLGNTIAILIHLARLESFGISYLAPWAPMTISDLKDTILKVSLPTMHKRPGYLNPQDADRLTDRRPETDRAGRDNADVHGSDGNHEE